jgi:hypothetical protein
MTIDKGNTQQSFYIIQRKYNDVDGLNRVFVVQEEGYGGNNILRVFSALQKAQSFEKKFKEIYPNKYSSSADFSKIKITKIMLDSAEKYQEEAGWIWNEFNFQ